MKPFYLSFYPFFEERKDIPSNRSGMKLGDEITVLMEPATSENDFEYLGFEFTKTITAPDYKNMELPDKVELPEAPGSKKIINGLFFIILELKAKTYTNSSITAYEVDIAFVVKIVEKRFSNKIKVAVENRKFFSTFYTTSSLTRYLARVENELKVTADSDVNRKIFLKSISDDYKENFNNTAISSNENIILAADLDNYKPLKDCSLRFHTSNIPLRILYIFIKDISMVLNYLFVIIKNN